jgi:uncharacterized protein
MHICSMRFLFIVILLLCQTGIAGAQEYFREISRFREQYKKDLYTDEHSPLKHGDTASLRFYAPDEQYVVKAQLILTPSAPPFDMLTHSGRKKTYRQYAIAHFRISGRDCSLCIYQSMTLIRKEEYRKSLFLPFNDQTNYLTTYAGGRYIDLSTDAVQEGSIIIDFNKCYNPYCAFAGGYSCPIPPVENRLQVAIEAGEQLFAGTAKE